MGDRQPYYQRSINTILDSVIEVYHEILLDDEKLLVERIKSLPSEPQKLMYRLILRKPGWLRVTKLSYNDISLPIEECISALHMSGLCELDSDIIDDYVDQLSLEELKDYCKRHAIKISNSTRRENYLEAICRAKIHKQQKLSFGPAGKIQAGRAPSPVEQIKKFTGSIVQLSPKVVEDFNRIIGLFFLTSNPLDGAENNLAAAILTDLNRRKYPKYQVLRKETIFGCRDDWIRYEAARVLYADLWETINESSLADEELNLTFERIMKLWEIELDRPFHSRYFLRRFNPAWSYTKCLHLIAEEYERRRNYPKSSSIYESLLSQSNFCHGRRGKWWERLIINKRQHLKDLQGALKACNQGLEDPHVRSSSRLALRRRRVKIEKETQWEEDPIEEITIEAKSVETGQSGRKLIFHIDEDTKGTVEELVLNHFANTGAWVGFHTESSVYTTLFGIMFWDIIFAPIPDAFQTPFQSCPLDFATDNFYPERACLINGRLERIATEDDLKSLLVLHYHEHHGTNCVGVAWESFSLEQLWHVIKAVGGPALSAIFRVLAEDYKNHRSGMPDLILYRPSSDGALEHMLVEVKSARDRLSDAQRHWAGIFRQVGVKMIVCKVKH